MNKTAFESLVGKTIKINRGGPESRTGKLLSVESDFFVLLTEDEGVVYYAMQHVKSITENSKNSSQFPLETPPTFEYRMGDDFISLLKELKYQWVKINRGGPEKLEGVLQDCTDDYVVLVRDNEVVRLATFHIKSCSYGLVIQHEKGKKEEENKEKSEKK